MERRSLGNFNGVILVKVGNNIVVVSVVVELENII